MKIYSDFINLDGEKVPAIATDEVKLRRPKKTALRIDFKELFGFIPERIIVQLADSRNNAFIIIAPDPKGDSPRGAGLLNALKEEKKNEKK